MRDCPIFRAEVIQERSCEFYVAAGSYEEALEAVQAMGPGELSDWMSGSDYDITVRAADGVHPRAAYEYGIYVKAINDWVQSVDDVPRVESLPDPNQLVMPLEENGVPHLETIQLPGGTL